AATGADGSALFNGSTPLDFNGKGKFWVSADGQLVSDITATFPQNGAVLHLSSQHLLVRDEAFNFGPSSGAVTFFSRPNGVVQVQTSAVPGTILYRPFVEYFHSEPVAFYSTRIAPDGTHLSKWTFTGLDAGTTIMPGSTLPIITEQPQSQTVSVGDSVN